MNIFYLDTNPDLAAKFLSDIHVGSKNTGGKMIIETAQMLANCYTDEQLQKAPKTQNGNVRKYSYFNHPCSKWVRESLYNWNWLVDHGLTMVEEKLRRGGKQHFCVDFLKWCWMTTPNLPDIGPTVPALAMPDQFRNYDPVDSYRTYYIYDKQYSDNGKWMMNYTNTSIPYWMPDWLKDKIDENSCSTTMLHLC